MNEKEFYAEFDRTYDEQGATAAILWLPFEKDQIIFTREDGLEQDRCIHCGELPEVLYGSPYRVRRTFKQWLNREAPFYLSGSWEVAFCDCWEPEGGYGARLEFR